MGNAQFQDAERTCGKFPSPAVKKKHHHHIVSSLRSVDWEKLQKSENPAQCQSQTQRIKNGNGHPLTTSSPSQQQSSQQQQHSSSSLLKPPKMSVFKTIKGALQEFFDPPEPERLLLPPNNKRRPPKHMLYGCTTAEEHYDYINAICEQVANLQGQEGLRVMGFEYRWVHHRKTCTCPANTIMGTAMKNDNHDDDDDDDDDDLTESDAGDNDSTSSPVNVNRHDTINNNNNNNNNNHSGEVVSVLRKDDSGYWEESEDGDDDVKDAKTQQGQDDNGGDDDDDDDEYGQFDLEDDNGVGTGAVAGGEIKQEFLEPLRHESFMVPVGSSLKEHDQKYAAATTASDAFSDNNFAPSPYYNPVNYNNNNGNNKAGTMSRNSSVLSLFSLATHNTDFSNPTHASYNNNNNNNNGSIMDGSVNTDNNHNNNNNNNNNRQATTRQQEATPRKSARFPLAAIASHSKNWVMEQDSCAWRLHHTASNTMVTAENHLQFMADGKMYDELARLCMEYAQQVMMQEGALEWTTICEAQPQPPQRDAYGAMVSRSYLERTGMKKKHNDDAGNNDNKDNSNSNSNSNKKKMTLLVVTGKGQVKAGIFSRRHLLVTSMEAATALPFIRGAKERNMDIIMLDPNALGYQLGMDVVETSLERLFLDRPEMTSPPPPLSAQENSEQEEEEEEEEVYILAHSMAGAQIVRFFTNNSSSYSRPPTPASRATSSTSDSSNIPNGGGATHKGVSNNKNDKATTNTNASTTTTNNNNTNKNNTVDATGIREAQKENFLRRIKALAFTDSNHNINWTTKHPVLARILTGPPSLYIKSHKVHEKQKQLGEVHHDCQFWRHRFGNIKTLWAGTHEHALTNYTARAHIWQHFDSFITPDKPGSTTEPN